MGKREPLGIVGEDVSIGAANVENRMEAPQRIKSRTTI